MSDKFQTENNLTKQCLWHSRGHTKQTRERLRVYVKAVVHEKNDVITTKHNVQKVLAPCWLLIGLCQRASIFSYAFGMLMFIGYTRTPYIKASRLQLPRIYGSCMSSRRLSTASLNWPALRTTNPSTTERSPRVKIFKFALVLNVLCGAASTTRLTGCRVSRAYGLLLYRF